MDFLVLGSWLGTAMLKQKLERTFCVGGVGGECPCFTCPDSFKGKESFILFKRFYKANVFYTLENPEVHHEPITTDCCTLKNSRVGFLLWQASTL